MSSKKEKKVIIPDWYTTKIDYLIDYYQTSIFKAIFLPSIDMVQLILYISISIKDINIIEKIIIIIVISITYNILKSKLLTHHNISIQPSKFNTK